MLITPRLFSGSFTVNRILLAGVLFSLLSWVGLGAAQTNSLLGASSSGRVFELVIIDRSGLTRYSASTKGAVDVVVTVASAQVEGLLAHVDGLSAPIRGVRINPSTIRFSAVAPGTWRVSFVSPGTDTPVMNAKVVSIRAE